MKIIRFDSTTPVEKKSSAHKMYLDETSFCCPNCSKKGTANFKGMIFRVLEFYCQHCGSFFKMTNPAFTSPSEK
jgi:predicted  nucleic acid-binding Zn ribbon protein